MRTEKLSTGWNEVSTKRFVVTQKVKRFQPASHWVDFTNKHPNMDTRGRNHCERCKCRWAEVPPETNTYFVMTDKGNKVVCETCWNEIEGTPLVSEEQTILPTPGK